MLYGAKFDTLTLPGGEMEYVRFGSGPKTLVMLPGLGESLQSMKGTQDAMALMYRKFAESHTVYLFSRLQPLPEDCSTRTMARDQKLAFDALGICTADLVGISMGGMIAQHLAIDYPEAVDKLVLVVTCARSNPILEDSIREWMRCAEKGDHTALMDSNVRRIYSAKYYRKNRWLIPIMGRVTRPKSYNRFFLQASACLHHDAFDGLKHIQSPTLVIGGEKDVVLGAAPSREIAGLIAGAELIMYPDLGHGLYEEAKDFLRLVSGFLSRETAAAGTKIINTIPKKGGNPMLIRGCQEGKVTPKLTEVKCPRCGEWVEVFIRMGGAIGETGTLISDETCACGCVLPAGSAERDYEQ